MPSTQATASGDEHLELQACLAHSRASVADLEEALVERGEVQNRWELEMQQLAQDWSSLKSQPRSAKRTV